MNIFPQLYTDRLLLRKIQVEDIPSLVKYADNKKISDHIINIPYPYREPDAAMRISYVHQGFVAKTRYVFAIILKKQEEFIGEISLHLDRANEIAELGYWIGEPFWNRGIATEATEEILKFGFEQLNLKAIYATCNIHNKASWKVLLNNGMVKNRMTGNIVHYSISKEAYTKSII